MPGRMGIPLDSRPEHAAALGRMLGHWAMLEHLLVGTLSLALNIRYSRGKVVWQEFASLRGKLTLIKRLNWAKKDDPLKKELDEMLVEATKLNEIRNAYIHALWVEDGGTFTTPTLRRMRNTSPPNYKKLFRDTEIISVQDIENDVIKIAELSAKFADWQIRVQGAPGGSRLEPVSKK